MISIYLRYWQGISREHGFANKNLIFRVYVYFLMRISEKLKLNSIAYDFTTKNTKITKDFQDLSHAASCSS